MNAKWVKYMGVAALSTLSIGMLHFPVLAEAGDLLVSGVTGSISGGVASYRATVTNHTEAQADPIMVLVWYEGGELKGVDLSAKSLSANAGDEFSVSLSGITVTDRTKVTGFILEDKKYAVPIHVEEVEREGNNSTKVVSIGATDVTLKSNVDETEKTIDLFVPYYQKTAEGVVAVGEEPITASVTVENAKTTVKIGDVTLTGDGVEKSGVITLADSQSMVVTSEDGTTATYTLQSGKYLSEDFDTDTAFSSEVLVGDPTKSGQWSSGTTNLAQGAAAEYFSTTWSGTATAKAADVSIGIASIGEAKTRGGATMAVGNSGASGNALRISKTTAAKSNNDNPTLFFKVENSAFKNAKKEIVLEYDVAIDYTRVTTGPIGCNGGGIRYFANDVKYQISDNEEKTEASKIANPLILTQNGTAYKADGEGGRPSCAPDSWYHVKTVITMPDKKATTYMDGTQIGEEIAVGDWYTGNLLVSFQTSGWRGADIWVDNIYVACR